mmetsp:Transcript_23639/g.70332  ORF Transcript_23639/g.70332 Transcript_23639/m.70332 type:complete len:533 (-) Transcript_23639:290-1888(-)
MLRAPLGALGEAEGAGAGRRRHLLQLAAHARALLPGGCLRAGRGHRGVARRGPVRGGGRRLPPPGAPLLPGGRRDSGSAVARGCRGGGEAEPGRPAVALRPSRARGVGSRRRVPSLPELRLGRADAGDRARGGGHGEGVVQGDESGRRAAGLPVLGAQGRGAHPRVLLSLAGFRAEHRRHASARAGLPGEPGGDPGLPLAPGLPPPGQQYPWGDGLLRRLERAGRALPPAAIGGADAAPLFRHAALGAPRGPRPAGRPGSGLPRRRGGRGARAAAARGGAGRRRHGQRAAAAGERVLRAAVQGAEEQEESAEAGGGAGEARGCHERQQGGEVRGARQGGPDPVADPEARGPVAAHLRRDRRGHGAPVQHALLAPAPRVDRRHAGPDGAERGDRAPQGPAHSGEHQRGLRQARRAGGARSPLHRRRRERLLALARAGAEVPPPARDHRAQRPPVDPRRGQPLLPAKRPELRHGCGTVRRPGRELPGGPHGAGARQGLPPGGQVGGRRLLRPRGAGETGRRGVPADRQGRRRQE